MEDAMHPTPPGLQSVLQTIERARSEGQPAALIRACQAHGGHFLQPGKASHAYEFSLFDVYARGDDVEEATRNWLVVARNLYPPPAQPKSLAERTAAHARALATLADPTTTDHPTLAAACVTALRESESWLERSRARMLLAAVTHRATMENPHVKV
jgi:hypothetical protein